MIARRRPVRAGRRWPARRTSNHARTSRVDRATDDPVMRGHVVLAPFQIHPERRIARAYHLRSRASINEPALRSVMEWHSQAAAICC